MTSFFGILNHQSLSERNSGLSQIHNRGGQGLVRLHPRRRTSRSTDFPYRRAKTPWRKVQWGPQGYSFCKAGELTWDTVTAAMIKTLPEKGDIPPAETGKISVDEAKKMHPLAFICGGAMRAVGLRG